MKSSNSQKTATKLFFVFCLVCFLFSTFQQSHAVREEPILRFASPNIQAVELVESGKVNWDKRNYQKSLEDCDKALQLDPQFSLALLCRSTAKQVLGDKEGALEDAQRLMKSGPDFLRPALNKISQNYQSMNYMKAINDLNVIEKITVSMFQFYSANIQEAKKANDSTQIILNGLKIQSLTRLIAELHEIRANINLNDTSKGDPKKALKDLQTAKNLYLTFPSEENADRIKEIDEKIQSIEKI